MEPMTMPVIAPQERPEPLAPVVDGVDATDAADDVDDEPIENPPKFVVCPSLSVAVTVGGKKVDVVKTVAKSVDMVAS